MAGKLEKLKMPKSAPAAEEMEMEMEEPMDDEFSLDDAAPADDMGDDLDSMMEDARADKGLKKKLQEAYDAYMSESGEKGKEDEMDMEDDIELEPVKKPEKVLGSY